MHDETLERSPVAWTPSRVLACVELAIVVLPLLGLWVSITGLLADRGGLVAIGIGAPLLLPGLGGIAAMTSLLLPRALGRPVVRQMHMLQLVGLAVGVLLAAFLLYAFSQPHSAPPVLGDWPIVWSSLLVGAMAVAVQLAISYERVSPCCPG